ncbi:hypothetical protein EVAR_102497_1 [Eumeta japonica]|uniref:Uncharacterized protein n=1 Tax=Eumeta variegata TaxID=151549 RepID=A0A4C1ZJA7_EUMVA|nr:hypothetical protein EVAR_102497_1 [Eumeta japonica]
MAALTGSLRGVAFWTTLHPWCSHSSPMFPTLPMTSTGLPVNSLVNGRYNNGRTSRESGMREWRPLAPPAPVPAPAPTHHTRATAKILRRRLSA